MPAFFAQQVIESQTVGEGGDRMDVSARQGPVDLQVAGGVDEGFAGQGGFQVVQGMGGQVGDVAQGLEFDLAVLPVASAVQGGALFHGAAGEPVRLIV